MFLETILWLSVLGCSWDHKIAHQILFSKIWKLTKSKNISLLGKLSKNLCLKGNQAQKSKTLPTDPQMISFLLFRWHSWLWNTICGGYSSYSSRWGKLTDNLSNCRKGWKEGHINSFQSNTFRKQNMFKFTYKKRA